MALNLCYCYLQLMGMIQNVKRAQGGHQKPSFKETLEAVYGYPITEQEAADALFSLTEFFKLLGNLDQEAHYQKLEDCHD